MLLEYARPLVPAKVGRSYDERSWGGYYILVQSRRCGMDVRVVQDGKCRKTNIWVAVTISVTEYYVRGKWNCIMM